MLLSYALDGLVLHEQLSVVSLLHIQLEERLRAEGGVGGHRNAAALAQIKQVLLYEVRVVLDLESLRHDLGVALDVQDQGASVVADAD